LVLTPAGINNKETGKESWPREPDFDFTPKGWFCLSDNTWNNGMMEKWNIGDQRGM
jgi:hypothetical protein